MAYDKKFRERVLRHVDAGESKTKVCQLFGLGKNTIGKGEKLREETGKLENRPLDRKPRKIDREKLRADIEANPDEFDYERAKRFNCSRSGLRDARVSLKITRKKKRSRTRRLTRRSAPSF